MGMLDEAISTIDATMRNLGAFSDSSEPILFLEPSCLSAVHDEWLSLKLKTPGQERDKLAARSMLVEDFIATKWDEHPREPRFAKPASNVYFHGHCHQKALFSAESGAAVLGRVCGDGLTVIDSGCCGMAGAFGMTRDHYDLSMKIGELVLLPAVREARRENDAIIVTSGTSCRHQIRDGMGERAIHPIELLDALSTHPRS